MTHAKLSSRLALAAAILLGAAGASVIDTASAAPTTSRRPSVRKTTTSGSAGWRVVVGGAVLAGVKVAPISSQVEVIEYQDSTNLFVKKRPGQPRANDVKIYGFGAMSSSLQKWYANTEKGIADKRTVELRVVDSTGKVLRTHRATKAFPSRLEVIPSGDKWVMTLAVEKLEMFD